MFSKLEGKLIPTRILHAAKLSVIIKQRFSYMKSLTHKILLTFLRKPLQELNHDKGRNEIQQMGNST